MTLTTDSATASTATASTTTSTTALASKPFWKRHLGLILLTLLAIIYSLRVMSALQDFHEFYLAGQRFLQVQPLYIVPERAIDWYMGYKYPPFFAMLMVPLGLLSFGAAKTVWVIVNSAALGGVYWLLCHFVQFQFPKSKMPKLIFLSFLASYIYFDGLFVYGQANLVLLVMQLGGVWWIDRGRPISGGLLIGTAAMMKLTPLIFIPYFIVRRQWRALLGTIGGFTICGLLPALIYGFEGNLQQIVAYRAYMAERHSMTDMSNWRINDNIQNLVYSIFGPYRVEYFGVTKNVFYFSTAVATSIFLFTLAAVAFFYLRFLLKNTPRLKSRTSLLFEVAILLALEIVLSPLAAKYTFVQLLPLIFLMFAFYDPKFKWAYWGLLPFGVLVTIPGSFTPHRGSLVEFYWVHLWYWCYVMILSAFAYKNYVTNHVSKSSQTT